MYANRDRLSALWMHVATEGFVLIGVLLFLNISSRESSTEHVAETLAAMISRRPQTKPVGSTEGIVPISVFSCLSTSSHEISLEHVAETFVAMISRRPQTKAVGCQAVT